MLIMEIDIGSNIMRNTNGVLNVQGKDQISLEINDEGQLLLTMDIYDSKKIHIAKLRRNAWVFNDKEMFAITTTPSSLKLIDKKSADTIVEVNIISKDKIKLSNGRFFTKNGALLVITPSFWRIGNGMQLSGNLFDSCGGGVALG
jgi:hypothetical protein